MYLFLHLRQKNTPSNNIPPGIQSSPFTERVTINRRQGRSPIIVYVLPAEAQKMSTSRIARVVQNEERLVANNTYCARHSSDGLEIAKWANNDSLFNKKPTHQKPHAPDARGNVRAIWKPNSGTKMGCNSYNGLQWGDLASCVPRIFYGPL